MADIQPIIDLLAKSGETTSEFKKARAAGVVALVLFALGVIGMICGVVTNVFGDATKVGIISTALMSVAGALAKAMVSMGYGSARADTKAAAGELAANLAVASATIPPAQAP